MWCCCSCCCSYWAQLSELERNYAQDLEDLHTRLQNQVAGTANKEKVQAYMERTRTVGGARDLMPSVN